MGEEQAVSVGPTNGKRTLKRYRRSSQHTYQSNLVPETGGLQIVVAANFSPWTLALESVGVTAALMAVHSNQRLLAS